MISNGGLHSTFCSLVYIMCSWNDLGSPVYCPVISQITFLTVKLLENNGLWFY